MNKKSYAGAAWNSLMEEETKESIAEMFLDSLDEQRRLRDFLKSMQDETDGCVSPGMKRDIETCLKGQAA